MPLYEYDCGICGSFELIRRFSDPPLEACPTCSGAVEKRFSAPSFQFKGTGWYVTDYARKGKNGESNKESGSSSSPASSDSKASTSTDSAKSDSATSNSTKPDSGKSDSAKSDSTKSSAA